MNVLTVTVLVDAATGGGTAERTLQLSRALVARGHQVTVLTTGIGLTSGRAEMFGGATVIGLRCLLRRFYVVFPRLGAVSRCVRNADVIHLMGHWNLLNVLVYVFARLHRKPYAICPAGELRLFGRSRWLKEAFNFAIGRRIVRQASAWIAVTPDERPQYGDYGIPEASIDVLPNGIVPGDLLTASESDVLGRVGVEPKRYILFMGRLNPIKGPDLLLEAFGGVARMQQDLHLVMAGPDGGLARELASRAAALGIGGRVHLVGFVAGDDKATLYRNALFLAIPSRHDAMSIVVLEAGVVSVPVLLTDRCGFDEVAEIGGGVVVSADRPAIQRGMETLLDRTEFLPQMGGRLNAFVMSGFTWDVAVERHERVFERLHNVRRTVAHETMQ
jgi:glycosyltransferase involved in cell wall biosynthesis